MNIYFDTALHIPILGTSYRLASFTPRPLYRREEISSYPFV